VTKADACLDDVNAQYLANKSNQFPALMTPARATQCMDALKGGMTLRRIFGGRVKSGTIAPIVTPGKLRNHCKAYPEWGAEAHRLAKANEKAASIVTATVNLKFARLRSAESRRNGVTCANGHVRTLENTFYVRDQRQCLVRRCKDCNKASAAKRIATPEEVRRLMSGLHHGQVLNDFRTAPLVNFLKRNPRIGDRVRILSKQNAYAHWRETWQSKRHSAAASLTRNNGEDAYEVVRLATAHLFNDERDDVMSRMFVAIAEGRLRLSEASSRVGEFLRDQRYRPRVFGDPRFSLDNPLGNEGGATWLDTKTDADRLWG
jgi:hypothetical protein